jgi:AcrR family transcriptional regulator
MSINNKGGLMSPRSEEQNEAIKDERREQILSAALRVFATKGYAAAKISDIVAQSGVSHGLVYHYFASKEEIFMALLTRALTTASDTLRMVEALPLSPIEKVHKTASYILSGMSDFEEMAYYFLIVIHALVMEGPGEKHWEHAPVGTPAEIMARILAEGQLAGEVREGDPAQMSAVFFAAIQGLAMYKLAIPDFQMPDPEILVRMVSR